MRVLELWRRLGFALHRRQQAEDLDEEMRLHRELRAAEAIDRGLRAEEATAHAQRLFGNTTLLAEHAAETWTFPFFDGWWRDLTLALRLLRKSPGFTLAAVLSLALGIGANTAVFSVLHALVYRPLPVREPSQLVHIGIRENNGMILSLPGGLLEQLRHNPLLHGVCGFTAGDVSIEIDGAPSVVASHSITGDCYQTLGVRPALGRLLTLDDDNPNGARVAVLGYDFWRAQYGGRADVLGGIIRLAGVSFQIVGVTEQRFHGLVFGFPPSVSAPISQRVEKTPQDPAGRFYFAETLARKQPSVSDAQLAAQLPAGWKRALADALPTGFSGPVRDEYLSMPPVVEPGASGLDYYYRGHFGTALRILLAVSSLLLLAACFNVGNLLVARGLARQREIAIRLSIGAARWRIVRQLLAESLLLSALGVLLAMGLTRGGIQLLVFAFIRNSGRQDLSFDIPVAGQTLLFAALLAVFAVFIFGVFPAWQTSDIGSAAVLKNDGRTGTRRTRSRRWLLAMQMAVTIVILVAAEAFGESWHYLRQQALRTDGDAVFNAQLMPLVRLDFDDDEKTAGYLRHLLRQIRSLPGVEQASLASFSPMLGAPWAEDVRRVDHPDRAILQAPLECVTKEFLSVMQLPLLEGQNFRDAPLNAPRTALLSQSVANRLFPEGSAVGRHIRFGSEPETRNVEVIGIVAEAHLEDAHKSRAQGFILLDLSQMPRRVGWGNLQVRYRGSSEPVAKAMRQAVINGGRQQVFLLNTLSQLRDASLLQDRMLAVTGNVYVLLASLLAAVGLFGLLSFFVSMREKEIGLRLALGATRTHVVGLIARESVSLMVTGIALSVPLLLLANRLFTSALSGVPSFSMHAVFFACAVLLMIGTVATLVPAWRGCRVFPNEVLRSE